MLFAAALGTALGLTACRGASGTHAALAVSPTTATTPPTTAKTSTTTAAPTATTTPAATSIVAQAKVAELAAFAEPGDPTPKWHLANPRELGGPLVLLVTDRRSGWVQVLLPVRPNGTRAWIRNTDVTLAEHSFRITVALGAHRLTVYNGYAKIAEDVIGVGTSTTPTPGGLYYTVDFVKLDDPSGPYGAYAYGLSGFSDVLTSFGGGPGQLAIHGTNEPDSLGSDASHGCIRLSNADISKLAAILPLGVPVQVVA